MIDFFSILDALSEAVYVTDTETNEILYLNEEGKRLFGDCAGKLCGDVFGSPNGICAACPAEKLSEDRIYTKTYTDSVTGKTYMLRDKLISWDGRKAKLEIAFDVTESERERSDLQMRLDVENFIVSCVLETHQTKPLHNAINNLLKTIGKFLDAERVYIFDYNGTTMSNTHEWCADGISRQIDTLQNIDAQIIDRWMSEFKAGKLVMIEDVEKIKDISPREYEELSRRNVKCMMAAPLDNDGKIIGFMGVDNPPKEKIISGEMLFSVMCYFVSSVVIREATERKLLEVSYTDTLTGMYNRNKFIEDTNKIADTDKTSVGVLYTDLNSLKEINDKYGHDAGDAVLKSVAGAVAETFGNDKVYRVGGDEFVVLCVAIDEKEFSDKIELLKKRLEILQYSSAIGYRYSDNSKSIDSIIKIADEEMYSDKKAFYKDKKEPGRYRARNDKAMVFAMPNSVKKYIRDERFVIWFQPRFDINTGEFCGSEALVRFFDDDGIIITPMDFIPEMERMETVHLVDFYVFGRVCEYISEWRRAGKNVKPISVNMSHRTMLKKSFAENLINILYTNDVPKELVVIEVTEERETGGLSDVADVLKDLKKHGFRIAIDNFGSKYADLYLIADLKFDILKLDGDMIYKMRTDRKASYLARSIVDICHEENIKIVAEDVESDEEMNILRDINCDEIQGYLFDKPMSWDKFEEKYL